MKDALRVFVVWVPKAGGVEENVPKAKATLGAVPAEHYFDPLSTVPKAYRRAMELGEDLWDAYLIYEPGVRWDSPNPPKARFWMHQLGEPGAPRIAGPMLDGEVFAKELRAVLTSTRAGASGATSRPGGSTRSPPG